MLTGMAAKEVKKVTESLTCPVCLQIFKNPKYLPCYHSYCEECLNKLQLQSEIKCPECREVAKVPEGGVKDLPKNFLINRLVDELILKNKIVSEEEVQCSDCDKDSAVVSYCPNCNSFLCHVCDESHSRDQRTISHTEHMVSFKEFKISRDVSMRRRTQVLMCKKHNTELLLYCKSCEELICAYCITKEHSGHSYDAVKELAAKHREELEVATSPMKEITNAVCKARENLGKTVKEIQKCGNVVEKDIDQHYDEIIQKLVKQKEEMKHHLKCKVSQKTKAIETQVAELELMQREMFSITELKNPIDKSSDQEMLSAKKEIIDRMLVAVNKFNKLDIQPVESATMEFISTNKSLPEFGQLFTHIDPSASEIANLPPYAFVDEAVEFTIITKYYSGHYCTKGGSHLVVRLQYDSNTTVLAQVRDNSDGSYTVSFVPKKFGEAKLFMSINGLRVRENPNTVLVRKTYLAVSKPNKIMDNNGGMGQPWGIAFSQTGMWAVTDTSKHCIYVFDKQDNLAFKIGSRGNTNGRFHSPYGIAFDADNSIYVADSSNHRVQKFDSTGVYLLQFGSKGSCNGQLNIPHGITVHDDKVYVADCNNHRISVFQKTSGEFCNFIGKDHLDAPCDLTINANNLLLAVDRNQHCISTFTLDGTFVIQFGSQGNHWGQLNEPSGLITDINDCILVADRGNHRVLIFDKDGNCINCIGSVVGSSIGEFNCPCGVALSSNGSIYINDSANKRIQVFSTF